MDKLPWDTVIQAALHRQEYTKLARLVVASCVGDPAWMAIGQAAGAALTEHMESVALQVAQTAVRWAEEVCGNRLAAHERVHSFLPLRRKPLTRAVEIRFSWDSGVATFSVAKVVDTVMGAKEEPLGSSETMSLGRDVRFDILAHAAADYVYAKLERFPAHV